MSRKPGRIIRSVESGSRRLARGVFGFSRSWGIERTPPIRLASSTQLAIVPTKVAADRDISENGHIKIPDWFFVGGDISRFSGWNRRPLSTIKIRDPVFQTMEAIARLDFFQGDPVQFQCRSRKRDHGARISVALQRARDRVASTTCHTSHKLVSRETLAGEAETEKGSCFQGAIMRRRRTPIFEHFSGAEFSYCIRCAGV